MADRPRLSLGILGPLELRGPDGAVPLPARTERTVVAALAAREGRAVTAAALAEDIWGEEGNASQKLVVAVSRLRNRLEGALGAEGRALVETVADGYRLAVEHVEVDATALTTLTQDGRRLLEEGSPAEARTCLEEALLLWRGDPLPELATSPLGRAAAARLAEVRDAAVDASCDASLALGDNETVVTRLEALLVDDPYRERRWAQLMLALYRAGRQAEALRAYQRVRTILGDELGIEPGPELRRLEGAILAHDPTLDREGLAPGPDDEGAYLLAVTQARWVHQQREAPLVGREPELERLWGDWDRVQAEGVGGVVFIEGDAGVGKTRLAAEVANRVIESGGRVVAASCAAGAGLTGLLPAVEALGLDPPDMAPGSPTLVSYGFEVARHVVTAKGQPDTLLVLDDAHWADEEIVALFARLGDQPLPPARSNTVMALVLVQRGYERPAGTAALVRNVERLPVHRHLVLGRLEADQTRKLAEVMVGPDGPPGLPEQIAAVGAGNPRAVVELARTAAARPPVDGRLVVPQSLREGFSERLELHADDISSLVLTAAVVGPTFTVDDLITATASDEERVLHALERALFARLLEEDTTAPGRYRFCLPLEHRLALELISSARRARIEGRLRDT